MKRELLDNGNIWQKSDGRWIGLVRYKDEFGVTQELFLEKEKDSASEDDGVCKEFQRAGRKLG